MALLIFQNIVAILYQSIINIGIMIIFVMDFAEIFLNKLLASKPRRFDEIF